MDDREEILENLNELLKEKKYKIMSLELQELNEFDIAMYLDALDPEQVLVLFRMLPKDLSADVFSEMDIDTQTRIVESFTASELNQIVENLAMDDAVDMIEELPANLVRKVLQAATADTRAVINQYLMYPDNSAGSIMTAEYIALKKWMNARQALQYVREHAVDSETIYTLYVTSYTRELEGVVTLKDLVTADPQTELADIMDDNIISAYTTEDQEDVAQTFNKYDLLALPVVDLENRVVGIITVDDMVDVIEQEATEDIEKMAALAPSEKPYLSTSVFELAKNRIFWLLFLMISSMLTGYLLQKYEDAFTVVPLLVTFIPMMTGTGGNAGSQSATLVIRGMTVGDIRPADFLKVWWKEIRVACLCGLVLAGVNFLRLSIQYPGNFMVCLTVVLSMFGTIVIAKSIGCLLPIAAKLIHVDPAIMAAPLISTILDACSLMLYFQLACIIIGL